MITQIGIVAGEIWNFLEENSPVSLSNILKEIDIPNDLVLMSLGWLAREGHVTLTKDDQDYIVVLR